MSNSRDPRLADAVRDIIDDVRRKQLAPEVALSRGVARLERIILSIDDGERKSDRDRLETESALARMEALGNGRDAAMLVARQRFRDPHKRKMAAQRYRKARRRERRKAWLRPRKK
ncbi:hypothetical protein ACVW16_004176 [Bradyrhizobium sp. USDA 4474]